MEGHSDLPGHSANGSHQQETQAMEEKDTGLLILLVPIKEVSKNWPHPSTKGHSFSQGAPPSSPRYWFLGPKGEKHFLL